MNYAQAVQAVWRHLDAELPDAVARMRELVRYAALAPSGHNSQPWAFRTEQQSVAIFPDFSRRTPVVDPDDHHLFVSLGCAAENLVQAARASGFTGEVAFNPGSGGFLTIALAAARAEQSALFQAIPARQCTRAEYDGRPLAASELRVLEAAGSSADVAMVVLTAREAIERVLEYVLQGNALQLGDRAFVRELEDWIRFDDGEAIKAGDGLSARAIGMPRAPRWLGRRLLRVGLRVKPENDRYARQIRSSAGLAVFVAAADDRRHWIEAGRCYERFALLATALGIRNAFVNQPVEVAALRPALAGTLGLAGRRPDLVVRFGRGASMPRSLRRPLPAVLL